MAAEAEVAVSDEAHAQLARDGSVLVTGAPRMSLTAAKTLFADLAGLLAMAGVLAGQRTAD
jgi:hypothetical protein